MKSHLKLPLWLLACSLSQILPAAESAPEFFWTETANPMPAWMENQVLYEVNIRQYSEAGTFAAIEADLDRIHALGAHTLWLMPIHPIGEINRKGELGSYYSVKDYKDVNPEFGDKAAFKSLVDAIHARGMRVILDWVANHSAWDNPLTATHPELYETNADGEFVPPHGTDWTDVIQFQIDHPGLVDLHVDAMRYWIETYGVDGFRCDFALGLPIEFWNAVSSALMKTRSDLFLLAESDHGAMQLEAFDATYGWEVMHQFDKIAQGHAPANSLDGILGKRSLILPEGAREMLFTSNHDENSWLGTDLQRLGGGIETFAVLAMTMDGIPLIYNGQEAALNKRLEFFQRDPIDWRPSPRFAFYQKLNQLKADHPAMRTGVPIRRIYSTEDDKVFAYTREADGGDAVLVVANLTAKDIEFHLGGAGLSGEWIEVFSEESTLFQSTQPMELESWGYRVYVKHN